MNKIFLAALVGISALTAPAILADDDTGVAAGSKEHAKSVALGSTETYIAVGAGITFIIIAVIVGDTHSATQTTGK